MKKHYWDGDRTAAMKYLRQCGLNDVQIGIFMGLSRERIAQLIGRGGQDPKLVAKEQTLIASVINMLKAGHTMADIERYTGNHNVLSWMRSRGLRYADYAANRLQARKELVIQDITAMLKAGYELNTYNLQRYDRNLYVRAMKVMGIKEWKRYFE